MESLEDLRALDRVVQYVTTHQGETFNQIQQGLRMSASYLDALMNEALNSGILFRTRHHGLAEFMYYPILSDTSHALDGYGEPPIEKKSLWERLRKHPEEG